MSLGGETAQMISHLVVLCQHMNRYRKNMVIINTIPTAESLNTEASLNGCHPVDMIQGGHITCGNLNAMTCNEKMEGSEGLDDC